MNLVAKEYISARDDESGVLILSQYRGIEGTQDALMSTLMTLKRWLIDSHSLEMDPADQKPHAKYAADPKERNNIMGGWFDHRPCASSSGRSCMKHIAFSRYVGRPNQSMVEYKS